jgi:uncharacterized protein YrrD
VSDRFAAATGRRVVSRASAEPLGSLTHLLVDAEHARVVALVVGKGRKAMLVDWAHVSGFGPDAVMIEEESALRPPQDDRERAAAAGKLELLGQRLLSDMGNDLGTITDVSFDPQTGAVETLTFGEREEPAACLRGAGSFAAVVHLQSAP